jgi:hypothetical protein
VITLACRSEPFFVVHAILLAILFGCCPRRREFFLVLRAILLAILFGCRPRRRELSFVLRAILRAILRCFDQRRPLAGLRGCLVRLGG